MEVVIHSGDSEQIAMNHDARKQNIVSDVHFRRGSFQNPESMEDVNKGKRLSYLNPTAGQNDQITSPTQQRQNVSLETFKLKKYDHNVSNDKESDDGNTLTKSGRKIRFNPYNEFSE